MPNKPDISAEESELFPYKGEILHPNWDKSSKVRRSEDLSLNIDEDNVMMINNMSISVISVTNESIFPIHPIKTCLYEFVLTQLAKINLFESLKVSVDMCFKTSSLLFQNNNTFYRE